MSPTCVKKPMLIRKPLLVAVLVAAAGLAIAGPAQSKTTPQSNKTTIELPAPGTVTVSDYEFNTFVFSEPAERVIFPAGSPVTGEPITLAGGTQVLLQFAKGADRPIQMVVELQSGKVETLRVVPKAVPGIIHPVNGAKLNARPARASTADLNDEDRIAASPRGADVELLKTLTTTGTAPDGFDPVTLPAPTAFDKFTVVPLAGWSDGERRVYVFSLVAQKGQVAVVSPNQFYRQGISAVLLDGDTVDELNSPQLFVVEELNDE